MKPEDQRNLATECGVKIVMESWFCNSPIELGYFTFSELELAAYTAAIEAPLQARMQSQAEEYGRMREFNDGVVTELQARIAQLEEALQAWLNEKDGYALNEALTKKTSSTWLSEHDKEVAAKEREKCKLEFAESISGNNGG